MLYFWIALLSLQAIILLFCIPGGPRKAISSFFNANLTVSIVIPLMRPGMAYMMISACVPKILSPEGFAELVAQYQMLPGFAVNFFSLWLPVLELIIGLGLIFTKWHREFTALLLMSMAMFIVALGQAVIRDLGITCGCFELDGAMDKNDAWTSMLRDLALCGPIIWMWVKGKNRYLWQRKN